MQKYSFLLVFLFLDYQGFAQDLNPTLLEAVQANDLPKVQTLVKQGADVNYKDEKDTPLLFWAVYQADLAMVKYLVEKKADYKQKGTIPLENNGYYGNLTGIAAAENKLDILKFLIEDCKIPIDDREYNVEEKIDNGWTALQWACSKGHAEVIQYLISKGAEVNLTDSSTPLIYAIQSKNPAAVKALLTAKVNVNQADNRKLTPIFYALLHQPEEICALLIAQGADIQELLPNGESLLHYFTKEGQMEKAIVLVQKGANFSTKMPDGTTPLHQASKNGFYDLVKVLIEKKAEVNSLDKNNFTPLMYAAYNNQTRICKLLIENGAKKDLKSNESKTALDYARERKMPEATAYLEDEKNYQEPTEWQVLNQEMVRLYNAKNLPKATEIAQKAVELVKTQYGAESLEMASALNNQARLYLAQYQYDKAEPILKQVLDIQQKKVGKKSPEYNQTLESLAGLYYDAGQYKSAEEGYEQLADWQKDNPQSGGKYFSTLNILGNITYKQGKYSQAERHFLKIQKQYQAQKLTNSLSYANLLNGLGLVYLDMGQYTEAKNTFKAAHEVFKANKSNPEYNIQSHLTTVFNYAEVFYYTGEYHLAEFRFKDIVDQINSDPKNAETNELYPNVLNSLATLYQDMGRYEESIATYQEALLRKKKFTGENHPSYVNILANLADVYLAKERFKEAESLYKKALQVRKKALGEKHPLYITTLNNLAVLYQNSKQNTLAEQYYKTAYQTSQKYQGEESPEFASYANNIGAFYLAIRKFKEADKYLQEALVLRKKILGENHPHYNNTLYLMAILFVNQGKYAEAEPYFLQALQGRQKEIQQYFLFMSEKEQIEFTQTIAQNFETFIAFAVKRAKKNPAILGELFNQRLLTKALLLNNRNKIRQDVLNSKDTASIAYYERWLNRKEYLNKLYALSPSELQMQSLSIEPVEKEVRDIEKYLNLLGKPLPEQNKAVLWQDIQQRLKPNELAVEMIRYEDDFTTDTANVRYAALVIAPQKQFPELIVLENGNELEAKYFKYYQNAVKSQKTDKYSYEQYWKRLSIALPHPSPLGRESLPPSLLERGQGVRLYFSPDGIFNQISLNSLQNPDTKKFVLDEVQLEFHTSLKELVGQSIKKENLTKSAIFFGYPNYSLEEEKHTEVVRNFTRGIANNPNTENVPAPEQSLSREIKAKTTLANLPGTKTEVENIAQIAQNKGYTTQTHLGNEALEEVIKQVNNPKVLHIATHGFFLQDITEESKGVKVFGIQAQRIKQNPLLRAGLMLTGAERYLNNSTDLTPNPSPKERGGLGLENGILTAYEAMNLRLENTDLVVLSACETGLGEIKNGEGVYGLQRAFIIAGAKAILMSLWTVSDEATQELMTLFYQNWLGGQDKKEAFRNAQLKLREKFPNPYHWGAFVMLGE